MDMSEPKSFTPNYATHPATTLREKREEMKISLAELAERCGLTEQELRNFAKERTDVTNHLAAALEKGTHIPAHFWKNRQKHYDGIQKKYMKS